MTRDNSIVISRRPWYLIINQIVRMLECASVVIFVRLAMTSVTGSSAAVILKMSSVSSKGRVRLSFSNNSYRGNLL
jgi:hypothetical protein